MSATELFHRPGLLPLLAAAPLAWAGLVLLHRGRARRLAAWAGPRLAALAPGFSPRGRVAGRALFAGGVLLAALALADPSWGAGAGHGERRGADVVVCLDVSRSMLARDEAPDRLGRARAEIAALAEAARGDRLALVAFAGDARLVVPLTADRATFAGMADRMDTLAVDRGGTDLAAALDLAAAALSAAGGDHGAVLLVTDGEDLGGGGLRAAERCRARGIAVHCLGLGSARGSKVPVPGPAGETFLRDTSGREVVTAMDPASLRRLAEAGGGEFRDGSSGAGALADLYASRILPVLRAAERGDARSSGPHRFQWPLLGAFLLLVVDLCGFSRRR